MDERISIIIPVYQVEEYLPLCLKTVLNQTYKNLEIILVDDGSPDECPRICEECAGKDGRVRVIHKENGGIADARNAALRVASGDYLIFVDSDDYVDIHYVECLYETLKRFDADIAVCAWKGVRPGEEQLRTGRPVGYEAVVCWESQEALMALLYQEPIDTCLWGKIFKRNLFDGIWMPLGRHYEDFPVAYRLFERAGRVCYNPYEGYFYLLRDSGITLGRFSERKMDLIDFADDMKDDLLPRYPQLEAAVWSRYFRANCHIYLQIPGGREYQTYRRRIEKNIRLSRGKVLKDRRARRGTRIAAAATYLGFPIFGALRRWKEMGKK